MNAIDTARAAYGGPHSAARSPRGIEYDLFARITGRLSRAWEGRQQDFPGLVTALAENGRLWSVLAADVADSANALPAPLRAQIFYLYEFTDRHSRAVMAGEADAGILVEINTAVMRGLRGGGGGA